MKTELDLNLIDLVENHPENIKFNSHEGYYYSIKHEEFFNQLTELGFPNTEEARDIVNKARVNISFVVGDTKYNLIWPDKTAIHKYPKACKEAKKKWDNRTNSIYSKNNKEKK